MEYEIVEVKEKIVVGITTQTSNHDERMPQTIGDMWERFFNENVPQKIQNRKNHHRIGLYSDYESDLDGKYNVTICCEVEKADHIPEGMVCKTIPSGKFAKFTIRGPLHTVIAHFWAELWKMDLDRRYVADFEEYQSGSDAQNSEIHIYIAINGSNNE